VLPFSRPELQLYKPRPPPHFALEFPFCFGVVCLGAGLVAQEVERTPAVVAAPDPAIDGVLCVGLVL